ncbi:hypothetical protein OG874_11025 [Nocardia sp. NBC_00565]|uniref:hypothetical protein n=1 Tax=Nocardia sp. NBC_00565 TaxID=2975993 RepID=UPI002E7FCC8A|nr:hypothetical protein [Nocardia sp. NBC_00565]WUC05635.1 hypothetical protein OG874_11025 [Nocardia sp. NBC_00565]
MSKTSTTETMTAELDSATTTDTDVDSLIEKSLPPGVDETPASTEDDELPPEPGASASDEEDRPPLRTRRWFRWAAVGTVAALVLVALSCAGVLGWKLKQARDIDSAANQARDAASQYAVTLTSVNSTDLDQNFAAVLNGATGEFKDMYTRSSAQLKQLLVDNKATAHGTVVDTGIKSASTTRVEVLLFIDQTITNTVSPDPRIDRSRVVMTMELVNGRWLAAKVDLP